MLRKILHIAVSAISLISLTGSPTLAATTHPFPDEPNVTTFAGGGASGLRDGQAPAAEFFAPTGLAFDNAGTLYVADRDGERIRAIAIDGTTTTIAGSGLPSPLGIGVIGGYRNGAADEAQFQSPQAVAVLGDKTLLIADTGNHCLRLLAHGIVSTFSGLPSTPGNADGPRSDATFQNPRSLAVSGNGDIFVADPPNGVRVISPDGRVRTLAFPSSSAALAIAIAPGVTDSIIAASPQYIDTVNTKTNAVTLHFPLQTNFVSASRREGIAPSGPATAIVAINSNDFVYVDPLFSVVREAQTTNYGSFYTRPLTAVPLEDAFNRSTAFRNGPGLTATFNEPLGVALAPDGRIAVADTGNRRIRMLTDFDHTTHLQTDNAKTELPAAPSTSEYRIALIGNSYEWVNQSWHASIGGMLEDRLNTLGFAGKRHVHVYPIMRQDIAPLAEMSLATNELAVGLFDLLIIDLPDPGQFMASDVLAAAFAPGWQRSMPIELNRDIQSLRDQHQAFILLSRPGGNDFPLEMAYRRLPLGPAAERPFTTPVRTIGQLQSSDNDWLATVSKLHAPVINLWPSFSQKYNAADRPQLFGAWDHHFTPAGRALDVDGIVHALTPPAR